jgi:hypothetical protein
MNGDWLDRLARRSVGCAHSQSDKSDRAPGSDDERYSRATAVKLAAAGFASVSLGLWRAVPAIAQDEGDCFKECNSRFDKFDLEWYRACTNKFRPALPALTPKPRWKQVLGYATFPVTTVQESLAAACYLAGDAVSRQAREGCWRNCEQTCRKRQSRSLQASRQACEPTQPPKNYTPAPPPPAPSMTADPCWSCVGVGGLCCGPFKVDASGNFQACACANPSLGCERYGCGG